MSWKLDQARLNRAAEYGETVAETLGFRSAPVDPFKVIASEGNRIRAYGDGFGDAFDGRLEFHGAYFLLFYNTKYDSWEHAGSHHPKVMFTIGHELGHYFLEQHRAYLMGGGGAHGSHTEFESSDLVEREADFFATGLLMPQYLLRRQVNAGAPTLRDVRDAQQAFHVSLTSMMIRWVQLCDFPCAVVSVRQSEIEWGFTSPGFKRVGGWRVKRGEAIMSRQARAFLEREPTLGSYRVGDGWSVADRWIDFDRPQLEVHEEYVVIPSTRQMLVFVTADEDDLEDDHPWE
jgi:hypothetical protein